MNKLTKEEQLVYDEIVKCNGRITQLQIAKKIFIGSHEKYENYDKWKETTLRKVRQLIRDLRIKHFLHILSDKDGYWIMKDRTEIKEYLIRIERTAKAQAKAWLVTYNSMRRNFGIQSEYFEQQGKLFE